MYKMLKIRPTINVRNLPNFVFIENNHHVQHINANTYRYCVPSRNSHYSFLLQVRSQHTGKVAKIKEVECKIDDGPKTATTHKSQLMHDLRCRTLPYSRADMEVKEEITVVTQGHTPSTTLQETATTKRLNWIYTHLRKPNLLWYFACQITIFAVGLVSKIIVVFMNKTTVYNKERLIDAVGKREKGTPLVTVSNHYSCFDDPGLWGVLPLRYTCHLFKIRWSMAAHDICFTNLKHSLFFMLGKCIPVIRGVGVYQEAIDLCIQKCALGYWVHVFPEGRVNMDKEELRLKWGVGRIIYESPRIPLILPMWHIGMDDLLPNVEPYRFQRRQKITFNIGEPLDLNNFIQDLKDREVPEPEARKLITDKIQAAFHDLRKETELLHEKKQ